MLCILLKTILYTLSCGQACNLTLQGLAHRTWVYTSAHSSRIGYMNGNIYPYVWALICICFHFSRCRDGFPPTDPWPPLPPTDPPRPPTDPRHLLFLSAFTSPGPPLGRLAAQRIPRSAAARSRLNRQAAERRLRRGPSLSELKCTCNE